MTPLTTIVKNLGVSLGVINKRLITEEITYKKLKYKTITKSLIVGQKYTLLYKGEDDIEYKISKTHKTIY